MCITKAITLLSCLWQALLIDLSITENKTQDHSPGVFTHDKTIFYLGVK